MTVLILKVEKEERERRNLNHSKVFWMAVKYLLSIKKFLEATSLGTSPKEKSLLRFFHDNTECPNQFTKKNIYILKKIIQYKVRTKFVQNAVRGFIGMS